MSGSTNTIPAHVICTETEYRLINKAGEYIKTLSLHNKFSDNEVGAITYGEYCENSDEFVETVPSMQNTKKEILAYITAHEIAYSANNTKSQLTKKIKEHHDGKKNS